MPTPLSSRAPKKKIRVAFADGTVLCYKNATTTYIEAIKKIGPSTFAQAGLEIGKLPVVTTECYDKYKGYMFDLGDGWWVNTQSDSSQKYLQLLSAKSKLGLDYEIQMAEEFDTYSETEAKRPRKRDTMCVVFGEDDYIFENHSEDAFVKAVERIGAEWIMQRCLEFMGKDIVTRYNKYPKQRSLAGGLWVTIPATTKDMRRCINYISQKLNLGIESISIIEMMDRWRAQIHEQSQTERTDNV